jgi:hypothetical protein
MPFELLARWSDRFRFNARRRRRPPLSSERIAALRTQEPEFIRLMSRTPSNAETRFARIRFGNEYTRVHAHIMYQAPLDGR